MKKVMWLVMLVLLSGFAAAAYDKVIAVEFSIDTKDKVKLIDVKLVQGEPTDTAEGDYSVELLDGSQVLNVAHFTPKFEAWADGQGFPFPKGAEEAIGEFGSVKLTKVELVVKLPYSEKADKFRIKKGTRTLYSGVVDFCNDNKQCEASRGENYLVCGDCGSGSEDDICDEVYDEICDPDCKSQGREDKDVDCTCGNGVCDPREDGFYCAEDCGKPINPMIKVLGGIVLVLILFIVLIVWLVKRKKKKK